MNIKRILIITACIVIASILAAVLPFMGFSPIYTVAMMILISILFFLLFLPFYKIAYQLFFGNKKDGTSPLASIFSAALSGKQPDMSNLNNMYGGTQTTIQSGLIASAKVLNLQQTGLNVSMGTFQNYQVRIDVNVFGPNETSWPAVITAIVPIVELAKYAVGNTISVIYDQQNPQNVALGTEIMNNALNFEATKKGQAVEVIRKELEGKGVIAKAEVLSYKVDAAAFRPGADLAIFELKVLPENESPFTATATCVVSPESAFKYQPGKSIFVRYDPMNRQKLVITGFDHVDTGRTI